MSSVAGQVRRNAQSLADGANQPIPLNIKIEKKDVIKQ